MQFTEIQAHLRENKGKGFSRRLRKQGLIPAVVYGKGYETKPIQVQEIDLEKIYRTKTGVNTLIQLNLENTDKLKVMIKEVQGHPITRKLFHIDFYIITENQKVEVKVPVRIEGRSIGVVQGGVREQFAREVELVCQIGKIPEMIVVDATDLNIGQNIHLLDIKLPEGASVREGYNPTIVAVHTPKVEEAAPAEAAPAAVAEGAEAPTAAKGEEAAKGDAAKTKDAAKGDEKKGAAAEGQKKGKEEKK